MARGAWDRLRPVAWVAAVRAESVLIRTPVRVRRPRVVPSRSRFASLVSRALPTARAHGTARRVLRGLLALGLGVVPGGVAQDVQEARPSSPTYVESVEVRVVEVDVVVTDRRGNPVLGLGREDFRVLEDGEAVELTNFYAVEAGRRLPGPEDVDGVTPPPGKSYLVVVVDSSNLEPSHRARVVRQLEDRLTPLVQHTTGVMVVNLGRSLTIENGFTRDPALLRDSLERILKSGQGLSGVLTRNSILRAIDRAVDPRAAQGATPDEAEMILRHAEADAVQTLGDIQSHVVERRLDLENCQRRLKTLVASLAGLNGRKAVLYVSSGYETRLGEALYRLWWAKFVPISGRIGINNIEAEINQQDLTHEVQQLVAHANANGAVFYAVSPGVDRLGPMAANIGSSSTSAVLQGVVGNEAGMLETLAFGTGGLALTTSHNVDYLIDGLARSLESYYSLGYSAELKGSGKQRRIKVEVDEPDLVVRYARGYLDKDSADLMEERTLAALLLDVAENPLAIGVELGEEERYEDGKFLLPVLIKIPIANLTLLPEEDQHVARVSVMFVAQDERGTSDPVHLALPISIPNAELLTALSRSAAYSARLTVRPGEQKLAIGVRDEIAQVDSTLNVVATVGDGASGSL